MISLNRSYTLLARRKEELLEELADIQGEIARQYPDAAFEQAWTAAGKLLPPIGPVGTEHSLVTFEVEPRMAAWLKKRLSEAEDDTDTFLNGLLMDDYLRAQAH